MPEVWKTLLDIYVSCEAKVVEKEAAVVLSAAEETALTGDSYCEPLEQGKGIIDCGATSALGSVKAVETIMKQPEGRRQGPGSGTS